MYQQHMLLKLRKPILKYTLNKYHVHWLSSFKHLKLPISIKIPVTMMANYLYLHDRYITKFDFMNFAFAKVVVGTSTPHTSLLELYQLFLTLFSFQTYFNFPRLRAVSNLYRYLISF